MSADTTTVLITGANRGVGRALAEIYLSRPKHTVIAGVRDPSAPTSVSLGDIKAASNSSLIVVKIDSTSATDAGEAVAQIKAKGVTALDIVVANAGIANIFSTVEGIDIADLRSFFETNTVGPLVLYKAVFPLLKATADAKGPGAPKFVGITSNAASIIDLEANTPYQLGAYGASKAAMNYLIRRSQYEHTWLTAFVINPGWVQTDMGNAGAKLIGMEKAAVPVDESVGGIVKTIDGATREATSGNFYNYDGAPMQF
ncbi:hypothetical protein diail_7203 [Diaporthe ilicicola]|nr:hypothetical protein diail_7203 [Diaporthe ilicicola]